MTMQDDLLEIARIKKQMENLAEEKAEVEQRLIEAMEQSGQKTISANAGDLNGTLVKSSTISIDEEKLKKSLGAPLWKKVTKQVLDKEKLEAHIVTGAVDANIVAAASTEKDRKPYVRVSGSVQPRKSAVKKSAAPKVATKNSNGGTKPAAARRVRKPVKP